MICCLLLAGLGIFGGRASRSYQALRRRDAESSLTRRVVEVRYSEHLIQVPDHEVTS